MSRHDEWTDLVDRLVEEVQSRPSSARGTSGDTAWSDLLGRLGRMARLFVDAQDVDDVVQAVALKLQIIDAISRMRAARSPEGYAFMMIRNASIDLMRRRAHQPVSLIEGHDTLDPTPMQDQVLERRLRQDELTAVLDGLSDSDRLLLTLRFWEELSIAEIAERFGMPYSSVAVRMFRLLRRLRAQLEQK